MTPIKRALVNIEAYEKTKNPEYLKEIKAIIQSINEGECYGNHGNGNSAN